jgi:hypothetical protein
MRREISLFELRWQVFNGPTPVVAACQRNLLAVVSMTHAAMDFIFCEPADHLHNDQQVADPDQGHRSFTEPGGTGQRHVSGWRHVGGRSPGRSYGPIHCAYIAGAFCLMLIGLFHDQFILLAIGVLAWAFASAVRKSGPTPGSEFLSDHHAFNRGQLSPWWRPHRFGHRYE